MMEGLLVIGRCFGMEMNVEKTKVVRISSQPNPVQMIDQKQLENVEYLNYLGIMVTNDARFTREIKYRIAMAKAAFSKKKTFHQQTGLAFKEATNEVLQLVHSFVW
jgi:hypothetical protein